MDFLSLSFIELLIAMCFVYALLSILVSTILEWINHITKARGEMLKKALIQMLDDPSNLQYGHLLFNHPLVGGMGNNTNKRPPQYISSKMFSQALFDIISQQYDEEIDIVRHRDETDGKVKYQEKNPNQRLSTDTMALFEKSVQEMNYSTLKELLWSFYTRSNGDREKLLVFIEDWYNAYMDRVSGWYQSSQKNKLMIVGFALTLFLNFDSIHMVKSFNQDNHLLAQVVSEAEKFNDNNPNREKNTSNEKFIKDVKSQLETIDELKLPLGWSCETAPLSWIFHKAPVSVKDDNLKQYVYKRNYTPCAQDYFLYGLGIIMSGFMLSFGAPFWFDLLDRFINFRRSGKKPKN